MSPKLTAPQSGAEWAVVSNHPFYPRIYFFASESKAVAYAEQEISDMHDPTGVYDESSVSVVRVASIAQITTVY